MITVEIMGGLGNQLFQIFTMMSYAFDNKARMCIEEKEIVIGDRKILYWDTLLSNLKFFIKPQMKDNFILREQDFHYKKIPYLKNINDNVKLQGYFQSYKYFQNNFDTIMKFVKFDEKKSHYIDNYCYEYTISLHFRVGDYKFLQDFHPLLSAQYYIESLKYIEKETGRENWQILYFCEDEDIEYVDTMILQIQKSMPILSFIKIDSNYSDWQQMLIMSLCRHNIIANSSFSWWGAYLNTQENIVCYPNTWFGPKIGNKKLDDLFPSSWHKIMH